MNALEYDIVSELYFIISYQELLSQVSIDETTLNHSLINLLQEGNVAQYSMNDEFEKQIPVDIKHLPDYAYLATKKGLLAHMGM